MRYTSIIHCGASHNIQSDFSGPTAREDFMRRCESMGAKWGRLFAETTGKEILFWQAEASTGEPPSNTPSASVDRMRQSQPVMALTVIAELATLVAKHGNHPLMFSIPDEGSFHIDRPKFDTDGADGCFLM